MKPWFFYSTYKDLAYNINFWKSHITRTYTVVKENQGYLENITNALIDEIGISICQEKKSVGYAFLAFV